jgi:signal transduction histidine kinase
MAAQFPPISVLLFFSTLVAGIAAVSGWRHRRVAGARPFVVLMGLVAYWSVTYGLQLLRPSLEYQLFWDSLQYPGGFLAPVAFFAFVLYYTGRKQLLTGRRLAALSLLPLVAAVAVWLPGLEALVRVDATLTQAGGAQVATVSYGPLFLLAVGYSYLLIGAGLAMLVATTFRSRRIYRQQAALISIGALVPMGGSVATYILGATVFDLTPIALSVFGLTVALALSQYRLLDVVPLARDELLTQIDDGIVVTDGRGQIVDINAAAMETLGIDDVIGTNLAALDSDPAETLRNAPADSTVEFTLGDDQQRHFECRSEDVTGSGRSDRGRLYIIREVTETRARERELEAQNERLDDFAGIVSHDLRNPLSVAKARTALLKEAVDDDSTHADHVDSLDDSLDRMETIIEETLVLAKQGDTTTGTDRLDASDLARDCWGMVETGDASVEVVDEFALRGDRERLEHVFENLFRNAVQHGGRGVTVWVGPLAERGFYVEDDGPGIPEEARTDVFDFGETSSSEGTGFGLAIVERIADAHGWDVRVSDGRCGGARFEFTMVDSLSTPGTNQESHTD